MLSSTAAARTWEVNADGSGDAPNVYAAMDSAASGDIVLLGPGHYPLPERLTVPSRISLIGRDGPAQTHVEALPDPEFIHRAGIRVRGTLEGIHLFGVSDALLDPEGLVQNCIIDGRMNFVDGAHFVNSLIAGIVYLYAEVTFDYCILIAQVYADYPIDCCFFSCDVFVDPNPNLIVSPSNLNFFLDPQFCGIPGSGNYFLMSTSPCLPENNPYGVPFHVGPLGIGCSTVTVKSTTWGAIKAMYMDKR